MTPSVTKSKNLDFYPYFFNYDDPSDIPFIKLAKKLKIHPNRLRGMIRPARQNSTIYTALRKMGYGDHQIPPWFARPDEPPVYRKAATAGPKANAENRSDAEAGSLPHVGDTVHTYVAQEKSAERTSALSVRSAPPAGGYSLVQYEYRPPLDPLIGQALRQIQESYEDEMRATLDRMKQRRHPPKPVSLKEIMAKVQVFNIMQQNEARNASQAMYWIYMLQAGRAPEPLDVEEIRDLFIKPFDDMGLKNGSPDREQREMIAAVGKLLADNIPQSGPTDDFIQRFEAATKKKEKREREALIGIAKIIAERNKYKNIELQILENQTKNIWDNFWKTMN